MKEEKAMKVEAPVNLITRNFNVMLKCFYDVNAIT